MPPVDVTRFDVFLLALAILLLALPVLGFSYETIMAAVDAQHFPPL